jgi:hypothetical protein
MNTAIQAPAEDIEQLAHDAIAERIIVAIWQFHDFRVDDFRRGDILYDLIRIEFEGVGTQTLQAIEKAINFRPMPTSI